MESRSEDAEGTVASSIFRDVMLFDILWPGGDAKAMDGSDSLTDKPAATGIAGEKVYRQPRDKTSDSSVGLFAELTNEILSEVDYSKPEFLDIRTAERNTFVKCHTGQPQTSIR